MSNANDFVIENGVLTKYTGNGGIKSHKEDYQLCRLKRALALNVKAVLTRSK